MGMCDGDKNYGFEGNWLFHRDMRSVKQNQGGKGNVAPFKKIPSSPDPKIERSCHFDPGCQAAVIGYNSPIPAMIEGGKRNRSSYKRRMEKKGRSGGEERDFILFAGTFSYFSCLRTYFRRSIRSNSNYSNLIKAVYANYILHSLLFWLIWLIWLIWLLFLVAIAVPVYLLASRCRQLPATDMPTGWSSGTDTLHTINYY